MEEISQEELGRRLRRARLSAGLSQEVVAGELGLLRPAVSQIESGTRGVSSIELAKLSRLYGRPLASFFEEDPETDAENLMTVLFRAPELKTEDRRVMAEFEALCRACGNLETLLDVRDQVSLPDYGSLSEPRDTLDAIRVYLALEAYRQGKISLGKLAELLGKSIAEVRELVWDLEERQPRASARPA